MGEILMFIYGFGAGCQFITTPDWNLWNKPLKSLFNVIIWPILVSCILIGNGLKWLEARYR